MSEPFKKEKAPAWEQGALYLCPTPIGNLEDMTLRGLRLLREADLIAAEDTRQTRKLLSFYDIHTPTTSYHEHNAREKGPKLLTRLQEGQVIALVTDAGTPGISDPGEDLVRLCVESGVPVYALPGAAACVTALVSSGLPTRRFAFEAFLPADKKERAAVIAQLKTETRTTVLYEAPHRLVKTLRELAGALGERRVTVSRELTKKHEQHQVFTLPQAADWFTENEPRGEFVIVMEGASEAEISNAEGAKRANGVPGTAGGVSLPELVAAYEAQGQDRKEAMRSAAKERGISRREVYEALLAGKDAQVGEGSGREPGGE